MSKYPIKKEFFPFNHLNPPISKGFLKIAVPFIKTPRFIYKDKRLDTRRIEIASYDGLLADYFNTREDVDVIVKGLRAGSDFENEFQMALTNRKLAPEIETLFMMPQEEHSYVTASMVRELVRYNQDASQFVTNAVLKHIRAYIERNRK